MKRAIKTFTETVEYDEFEVGDRVVLRESFAWGCLPPHATYTVTKFVPPISPDDEPMVFGEGHQIGMTSHCFRLAEEEK